MIPINSASITSDASGVSSTTSATSVKSRSPKLSTPLLPIEASASQWQAELRDAITDPAELLSMLELPSELLAEPLSESLGSQNSFPLRVPRSFVQRMVKGDPHDPLLRQVLPIADEQVDAPGFGTDPVGDLASQVVPGVLHKYHGRALLVTTGACAVHCRYCFRREYPYDQAALTRSQWQAALDYLRADNSIKEVLLSGGDPLSLTDRKLADLLLELSHVPHVQRIRLHTRQPIVLPSRVTPSLCNMLQSLPQQVIVVVHVNHANELNAETAVTLQQLRQASDALLNQSVLLAGVNDSAQSLLDLSEKLFTQQVLPYYLHLLDKVQGASHFWVSAEEAKQLLHTIRTQLPGYLVPKLVQEITGAPTKMPV